VVRESKNALIVDSANAKQIITIAGKPGDLLPLHRTAHGAFVLEPPKIPSSDRLCFDSQILTLGISGML
jgi:DNA-binding IclR family transcriptional regulator